MHQLSLGILSAALIAICSASYRADDNLFQIKGRM